MCNQNFKACQEEEDQEGDQDLAESMWWNQHCQVTRYCERSSIKDA